MTSMADLTPILQALFGPVADRLARQTGCVQRALRFTGSTLLQTLVFGYRANPAARLAELAGLAARLGVTVTPQGLAQRFSAPLADLLRRLLALATQQTVARRADWSPLLAAFPGGIWLVDSTTIALPAALASDWPGCGGGAGQGAAALKVHPLFDLASGALGRLDLTPGRASDRGSAAQHTPLPPGSLRVHDRQYVTLAVLRELAAAGSDWLSRWHGTIRIAGVDGLAWTDLAAQLAQLAAADGWVDVPVLLGAGAQLPARLLAVRLPPEQADRERAGVKRRAQRAGYTASDQARALAGWLLVITSVDATRLTPREVLVLLRARWQIERLFRRWKQHGLLTVWHSAKTDQLLCEVLAKLLGCLLDHWLVVVACWELPDRSLDRASRAVSAGMLVLATVFGDPAALTGELERLADIIRRTCRITTRRARPNLLQLLADPNRQPFPGETRPATASARLATAA
jgi:hypothetical protein